MSSSSSSSSGGRPWDDLPPRRTYDDDDDDAQSTLTLTNSLRQSLFKVVAGEPALPGGGARGSAAPGAPLLRSERPRC